MSDSSKTRSSDEIKADIEETRDDLGDTVEALAAKTDVKTRAKSKADELKGTARAKKDQAATKLKEAMPSGSGDTAGASDGEQPPAAQRAQELGDQALTQAKANPVPLALVGGIVLGYLIGRARS